MQKTCAAIGAAFLVGCAAPMSIDHARAIAANSPEWELCYVAISGRGQQTLRQAVYESMQARRTDCNKHAPIVQAKLAQDAQNSAAQAAIGLQLMRAGQAKPAGQTAPVYCRSVPVGGGVNTVCD